MKHWILGTIILCLFFATGMTTAQDQHELERQLLADIGVTEAELMQFGVILVGIGEEEEYQKFLQENEDRFENTTRENYVELVEDYFNNIVQPLIGDIRAEAVNFFSEDQYSKMVLTLYQVAENVPGAMQSNGVDMGALVQLVLLPDLVSFTEEQMAELAALQKEVITEIVGIEIIMKEDNAELFAEQEALFQELQKAETDEEKAVLQEKFSKATQKTSALMREQIQKAFDKTKAKLDKLLTAEQKAKLAQIKQDIPDYLKKALAEMGKADDDSEVPTAWRPGANSWVPGMGAPKDRENYPGEAPRVRKPQERRFPGSE